MFRPLDLPWRFGVHALLECGVHISLSLAHYPHGALFKFNSSPDSAHIRALGSSSLRTQYQPTSLNWPCHNPRSLLQTENTEKGESRPATISYMAISDLSVQETMGSPSFREKVASGG